MTELEVFKKFIDDDSVYVGNNIIYHVQKNKQILLEVIENDIYGLIFRTIIDNNLTEYTKSTFSWKYIQHIRRLFMLKMELTEDDLEIDRMTGVTSDLMYFYLLRNFLKNHDVIKIPKSFIEHFECLINKEYLINIAKLIYGDNSEKVIQLMILFLEKYDANIHSENIIRNINIKEDNYLGICEFINYELDNSDQDESILSEDNFVELSLEYLRHNKLSKEKKVYLFKILSNYFEWMKLDEQMEFWNILSTFESDNASIIEKILFATKSQEFNDYVFNNYVKLKTEDDTYDLILAKKPLSVVFLKKVVDVYPELKDSIIIHIIINTTYISLLSLVFPDLTNQEIVFALKNF